MPTKGKGRRTKKHLHSAHHRRHPHSAHHRRHPHSAHHRRHPHSAHHRKTMKKTSKHKRTPTHKRKHKRNPRHTRKRMHGGMAVYPDAHIPDEMNSFNNGLGSLGNSYNAGVAGQPGGNHYAYNTNVKAAPMPSNPQAQIGGRRRKCKCKGKCKCNRRGQRGGGFSSFVSTVLPEELVNVGRAIPSALGHLADKFNGDLSHPSSLVYPTQQPHVYDANDGRGALINPNKMSIADIRDIYAHESDRVSAL